MADNPLPDVSEGYEVNDSHLISGAANAEATTSSSSTTTIQHPESTSSIPLIHQLAQQGDLTRIRDLLDRNEAKATDVDAEGITALHWAAMNSALDVCRLLLERGAEVDAVGGELQATPLHWATR